MQSVNKKAARLLVRWPTPGAANEARKRAIAYVPIATSRMIAGLPLVGVSRRIVAVEPDDDRASFAEWRHWPRDNRHLHEAARAA